MANTDDREATDPLARFVGDEARRRFFDPMAGPDPRLVADGWERRFITDTRRAVEVMELYESLGFDVCAKPIRPDELADDCHDCQLATFSFRSIYTRPRAQAPDHTNISES